MTLGMQFRHWIAVSLKFGLPIPGRLYPAHYSLLYYTKGKPKTFRRIRTPIETCRHCGGEIKDYGGHRDAMNERGVNLMDVWTDVPPVRHGKFKSSKRKANAVSTKILDRVVEMTTREGELVLDPFGGSGTTFAVCERKNRRWLGIEIDSTDAIIERLIRRRAARPQEPGPGRRLIRPARPPVAPGSSRPLPSSIRALRIHVSSCDVLRAMIGGNRPRRPTRPFPSRSREGPT